MEKKKKNVEYIIIGYGETRMSEKIKVTWKRISGQKKGKKETRNEVLEL